MDDKSKNKKRDNIYDIIKMPLLVCAIVGLLLNIDLDNLIGNNLQNEILIIKPNCNKGIANQDIYVDLNY